MISPAVDASEKGVYVGCKGVIDIAIGTAISNACFVETDLKRSAGKDRRCCGEEVGTGSLWYSQHGRAEENNIGEKQEILHYAMSLKGKLKSRIQ